MSFWEVTDEIDLQEQLRKDNIRVERMIAQKINEIIKEKEDNQMTTYRVTTEADCEGRYTTDLGVWQGTIEDIALHLADKCYYRLTFEECLINTPKEPTKSKVSVSLRGNLKMPEHTKYHCKISDGLIGQEVTITIDHESEQELIRRNALNKLSNEERIALGLKL